MSLFVLTWESPERHVWKNMFLFYSHQHKEPSCLVHSSQDTSFQFLTLDLGFKRLLCMKMAVFWVVALCSLVNFYQTTWCYNPEGSHLHTHCHENLSYLVLCMYCLVYLFLSHTVNQQFVLKQVPEHYFGPLQPVKGIFARK
jgi:hypothetical protein